MATDQKSVFSLEFVLTADGFTPELSRRQPSEEDHALLAGWKDDRWTELYHLALGERPEGLSQSALYLHAVAETFFRTLTSLPELELAREKVRARLSEEETVRLLQSVPFVLGSELVDRAWLEMLFQRLNGVFSREIKDYDGTVAFYLAEQSQRLRVPERIFSIWWRAGRRNSPSLSWLPTLHRGKTDRYLMSHCSMR